MRAYLAAYGARVRLVAIVGDADTDTRTCNTDPAPHALRDDPEWRSIYCGAVRSVPPAACMVVYERVVVAAAGACVGDFAGTGADGEGGADDGMDDADIDAI